MWLHSFCGYMCCAAFVQHQHHCNAAHWSFCRGMLLRMKIVSLFVFYSHHICNFHSAGLLNQWFPGSVFYKPGCLHTPPLVCDFFMSYCRKTIRNNRCVGRLNRPKTKIAKLCRRKKKEYAGVQNQAIRIKTQDSSPRSLRSNRTAVLACYLLVANAMNNPKLTLCAWNAMIAQSDRRRFHYAGDPGLIPPAGSNFFSFTVYVGQFTAGLNSSAVNKSAVR